MKSAFLLSKGLLCLYDKTAAAAPTRELSS